MNPMMWSSTSWDGTGLCVYAKRLERGKFACLWSGMDGEPVRLTTSELGLFLEGSRFVGKISLSPPEMTQFSLATGSRS
jgi:transposase